MMVDIWGKKLHIPDMVKGVAIFDLDGTLACGKHRLHLLPTKDLHLTESWLEFNRAGVGDAPIRTTIAVMNAMYEAGYFVIILTGRSDDVQHDTIEWLRKHHCRYDRLIMRRGTDNRKDTVIKEEVLRAIGLDRIVAAWDDSPNVIAHMRGLGLTVYQVCDYGDASHRTDIKSHGVEVLK